MANNFAIIKVLKRSYEGLAVKQDDATFALQKGKIKALDLHTAYRTRKPQVKDSFFISI